MAKNQQLAALNQIGQSIWYDNLSRDVLKSGELARLIAAGVSGLTSNPTIFKKAIADSSDYDEAIQALAGRGLRGEALCEELMIADVQRAADLLAPAYEQSAGGDGYASLEVSPFLAHDGEGTVLAARRLWGRLDRPNVMIKVPATGEGIEAIRELLSEGINVNVTLIFSLPVYSQVIAAYLAALEERQAAGLVLKSVASVASFFVSRVDAIVEKELERLISADKVSAAEREAIVGKVGVANSRAAYRLFQENFAAERFQKLQAAGARVQRPLWASTGTKNPAFSPVMYVEELAGPDTVNTLPPATLAALLEQGDIAVRVTAPPQLHLADLLEQGIDLDRLLVELSEQGVKSFADSYQELLAALAEKTKALGAIR